MDLDWDMAAAAVGAEKLRECAGARGGGPVMAPWLRDGGLDALVPGGGDWMTVAVSVKNGAPEARCDCGQAGPYCSHSMAVMAYAAANADYLRAVRAAEDEGIREAAKIAEPEYREALADAALGEDPADRSGLRHMQLTTRCLPPRGIDYGRWLDMGYVGLSAGCFLEESVDIDFDTVGQIARRFAASGDLAEAARIYCVVAETIAKNVAITDDSNAHYSTSLKTALGDLSRCMVSRTGRPRKKMPAGERKKRISWLVRRVALNDPDFFTEDFASALDSVCVAPGDREWRRAQERLRSAARK